MRLNKASRRKLLQDAQQRINLLVGALELDAQLPARLQHELAKEAWLGLGMVVEALANDAQASDTLVLPVDRPLGVPHV